MLIKDTDDSEGYRLLSEAERKRLLEELREVLEIGGKYLRFVHDDGDESLLEVSRLDAQKLV